MRKSAMSDLSIVARAERAEEERDVLKLALEGKQQGHSRNIKEMPLICFYCGKHVPVAFNQCTDCREEAETSRREPKVLWGWEIDEIKSVLRQFQSAHPGQLPTEVERALATLKSSQSTKDSGTA